MSPDEFKTLVKAGLNTDQIAVVMEMIDARDREFKSHVESNRQKAKERVQKWRNKKAEADVTLQEHNETLPNGSHAGVARGDYKQTNLETNKVSKKEDKSADKPLSDLSAFKAELIAVISEDRINGIVDVRRKKKAPLSANTGKLLAKALLACPDVDSAADEMVLRNWIGIKPEWLGGTQSHQSQAPPAKLTRFQEHHQTAIKAFDRKLGINGHDEPPSDTFDLEPGDWRSH